MEESAALTKDRDNAVAKAARLSAEAARQAKSLAEAQAQIAAAHHQLKLSVQPDKVCIAHSALFRAFPFRPLLLSAEALCPT